jgi:hypothetical protein
MSEPTTTLTDALLAILATVLGLQLAVLAQAGGSLADLFWVTAFLGTAVTAGLGSLSHGFGPRLKARQASRLWVTTLVVALVANAAFLAAVLCLALDGWPRTLGLMATLVGLIASLRRVRVDPRYRHVITAGAATIVVAGLLTAWAWWQGQAAWAPWVAAGLVVSAIGAVVQRRGIGLTAWFNHNDVYHVLQGLALILLYRAATVPV